MKFSATLRRLFGTQTIWYLHSHTVCARLFLTVKLLSPVVRAIPNPVSYGKELSF